MRQGIGLAVTASLMLVACSGPSSPGSGAVSPSISERPTSSPTSVPSRARESKLPVSTPTLAPGVIAVFNLRFRPSAIVNDGALLWAEDHASTNRIYAVDPATGETKASIDVTRPCDLAVAFDRIWVADLDAGRLLWIDPTTQDIGGEVPGLHGPCGVQAVDGALWMVVEEGLARVDPVTGSVTTAKLAGGGAFPGAGTPFWAASYTSGDLLRVDTTSMDVERTVAHPAGNTEGPPVAAGFGALWVGGSPDHVYRLDAKSGAVEAEIASAQATRLLVTADAVWLTSYPNGVVERIDPTSNEVVFRAKLGGNLNGITEGLGSIWVAETGTGRLYRLDPAATGLAP